MSTTEVIEQDIMDCSAHEYQHPTILQPIGQTIPDNTNGTFKPPHIANIDEHSGPVAVNRYAPTSLERPQNQHMASYSLFTRPANDGHE